MFIISLTYITSLKMVDQYLDEHISYLKKEYKNKNFILSGKKNPRNGGVILSNLKTKNEIESVLAKDPFCQNNIAKYDIIEFIPTMASEELQSLL